MLACKMLSAKFRKRTKREDIGNPIGAITGIFSLFQKPKQTKESVVFKLDVDEKLFYSNKLSKINSTFTDNHTKSTSETKQKIITVSDIMLGALEGPSITVNINVSQRGQILNTKKMYLETIIKSYEELCEEIVNDIKTLFNNKSTDTLTKLVDKDHQDSFVSTIGKFLKGSDKTDSIGNITRNTALEQTINLEFENLKKTLKKNTTNIEYINSLYSEIVLNLKVELEKIKVSKIALVNIDISQDVNKTIFEEIQIKLISRIFSSINDNSNFSVTKTTTIEQQSSQLSQLKEKITNEKFESLIRPFTDTASSFAYSMAAVGIVGIGAVAYFLFGRNKKIKPGGFIEMKFADDLPEHYFKDEGETSDDLIKERRHLLKTKFKRSTNKLSNLFYDLKKLKVNLSNMNSVRVPLFYYNKKIKRISFDNKLLLHHFIP